MLAASSALGLPLGACSSSTSDPGAAAGAATAGSSGSAGSAGTQAAAGASSVAGAPSAGSAGAASSAGSGGTVGLGGAGSGGSAGATAGTGGAAAGAGPVLTGTAQIMVLGSSNELITCWRALLWQKLRAANITNFDFIGGVTDGPDCGVPGYDKDLQAQSGIIISNLKASDFAGWFSAHPPQVILMHFGGADLLMDMPIDGVLKGYSLALAQARIVNPKVILLIAQHTPEGKPAVVDLNADIVTWAASNGTAESPVIVVDLYTGLDPVNDFSDGVHLNASGSEKVATRWFDKLAPLFKP